MKHLIKILLLLGVFCSGSIAQDCNVYFPFEEGVSFEVTNYNARGKKQGTVSYAVKEVSTVDGKQQAIVSSQYADKKGNEQNDADFKMICGDDKVSLDLTSILFTAGVSQATEGMEISADGDLLDFPLNPQEGQSLPDSKMDIKFSGEGGGSDIANVVVNVTNRKIEGKEEVECPAGKFEAWKISYDVQVETEVMGIKVPGAKTQSIDFIAPGHGNVRNEVYNKNGKLQSYSELTEFSR
ncbi:hypothetical protein RCC89_19970 [Cytophagaceae bacterium ABcell3]|nr:hypothetical protein RCC89_19970 [Cytophagaceae bacterium ABcell3]